MIKVSLKEAEGHLGELIEEAAAGQEVVITSDVVPRCASCRFLQASRK